MDNSYPSVKYAILNQNYSLKKLELNTIKKIYKFQTNNIYYLKSKTLLEINEWKLK